MTRFNFAVDGLTPTSPVPSVTQIGPLFTSGLIPPQRPRTGAAAADGIDAQAADLFEMIGAHLTAAGIDWDDVAKLDFYLTDLDHTAAIDSEWVKQFPHASMRPVRDIHHRPTLPSGELVAATFVAYRVG